MRFARLAGCLEDSVIIEAWSPLKWGYSAVSLFIFLFCSSSSPSPSHSRCRCRCCRCRCRCRCRCCCCCCCRCRCRCRCCYGDGCGTGEGKQNFIQVLSSSQHPLRYTARSWCSSVATATKPSVLDRCSYSSLVWCLSHRSKLTASLDPAVLYWNILCWSPAC